MNAFWGGVLTQTLLNTPMLTTAYTVIHLIVHLDTYWFKQDVLVCVPVLV